MGLGISTWAAVVLWGVAGWAAAQERPAGLGSAPEPPTFQLPPGARVRVTSSVLPGGSVEGRVASSTDDTLGLMVADNDVPFGGGPLVVPRASVTSLQVSLGPRRYTLPGAVVGALLGAAGGAASEVDPRDCGANSEAFCSQGEAIAISAVAGAALGALVGHVVKTERWQKVDVEVLAPRSASGRAGHRGRGAAVAAQVAFRF